MRILCIGSSNTYGHDPRSYIGSRYPKEVRWTGRLEHCEVINFGVNGLTIPCGIPVFVDVIRKHEPDLVVVMLGSNDLLEGASAKQTCARMEEYLESIIGLGIPILLIAPPPFERGECVQSETVMRESQKLGNLYRDLAARKGCLFADAGEWDIKMTFDGIHFSPNGHDIFAQKLDEKLKKSGG